MERKHRVTSRNKTLAAIINKDAEYLTPHDLLKITPLREKKYKLEKSKNNYNGRLWTIIVNQIQAIYEPYFKKNKQAHHHTESTFDK